MNIHFKRLSLYALPALVMLAVLLSAACSSSPQPTTTGPGGAVINSDSIITAQIQSETLQTSGYKWSVDILIQDSVDVGDLPNPTKDDVGKTITVLTDDDMTPYVVGDAITARVKYAGDVPKPGVVLYMYDVAPIVYP